MSQNNGNNDNSAQKEQIIDFGAIFNKYKRYWWLFAASVVVCLGLASLYLMVKLPVYEMQSMMLVGQDDDSGLGSTSSMLSGLALPGMGSTKVDNEVLVVDSKELYCDMINRLKLNRSYIEKTGLLSKIDHYNDSPIEINAPNELFDTLSVAMKFKIKVGKDGKANITVKKGMFKTLASVKDATLPVMVKTSYGLFQVTKTRFFKPGQETKINAMVVGNDLKAEDLNEVISTGIVSKKADAISISIKDNNVKRGKDILNTMMSLYNERGHADKNELAINTGKFIDERLALIYTELNKSEAEIERFKQANKIYDVEEQAKTMIAKQTLAERGSMALETRYRIAKMVKDFISDPHNRDSYIPFSVDSTAAAAPIAAYNRLILQRARLEASAKSGNAALREIDDQIVAMRTNVRRSVDNTLHAISIQQSEMNAANSQSEGDLSKMPAQEREGRSLLRQQGIQNELYTFLLQKREENALMLASTTPKGKIVDHAFAGSEPVAPKASVVLLVGLVMGFIIPLVILYLKALFTTKFSTTDELQSLVNVPVLGEICHNRHSSSLVVKPGKTSSIVELFRLIRNNLQFMLTSEQHKVIVVTSSVSGEGKSFVSTNIAASFALLGKRVALVGMDIRSPQLAKMLNLNLAPGVTTYLAKADTPLSDLPQHVDAIDTLEVLVGGPVPPNPSELLLSKRVDEFFKELRENYDLVIIDSAPIAMVSDTFSIVRHADAVVYVTRANYTKRSLIKYFNGVVARGQIKNVAVVLNDSNPRMSQGYGYGYGSQEK